jgi:predicted RNase H-like HicB family nuclease
MSFPVLIEKSGKNFAAILVGVPGFRVVGASRNEAIAAIKSKIEQHIEHGELLELEVGSGGLSDLAGKYADDPTLREICEEVYRRRDDGGSR